MVSDFQNLFSVEGKVVVVTGGSRGIGRMIAEGMVKNGAKVYISSRNQQELQATNDALAAFGYCRCVAADLSLVEGVAQLQKFVASSERRVDILVNNAGAVWGAAIDDFSERGWDKVMDINLKSVFFLTQRLLPMLRESATAENPARVINISSIQAFRNSHMDNIAYTVSKAAVLRLTEHLSTSLAADAINVNGIAPGYFPSKMTEHILGDDFDIDLVQKIPMGRTGRPEDIASAAIYLASRASAYMTGHTIVLDGGFVAGA